MDKASKYMLTKLYVYEMNSIPDIGNKLGVSYSKARLALIKAGIKMRSRADGVRAATHKLGKHMRGRKREFTAEWKANIRAARIAYAESHSAGVTHKSGGYSEITRGPNKHRGVHVVKMELHLGRRLAPDEVVHHIDGNKQNNELSNLMLMTRSSHTKLHRAEKAKGKNNG